MLVVGSAQALMGAGDAWRPDPRASLTLALGVAVILCFAFVGLLYRRATATNNPALLSLSVVHTSARKVSLPHVIRPPVAEASPLIPPPPMEPLPPVPGFILLQEQVDAAVRDTVLSGLSTGPFLMPPAQRYDDLDRALQAPSKPGALRDGEGYRSLYGDKIVKSGDGCAAMEQVQVGPAAKADVGFIVPCPGGYRPNMADQLAEWADKRAQLEQQPPR